MIATKSRTWYAAALVFLMGLTITGCDHVTDSEGPNLIDRFGDFFVVDSLMTNRTAVDFTAGESVVFTARFNKQVDWIVEITGDSSGAVKRIEGFSNELTAENASWLGGASEFPLFKSEPVTAALLIVSEDADTLRTSVEVVTPREYDGDIVTGFEEDDEADIFLGNFEFEFDLQATGRSDEVPPAEGDFFYLLRSTGGPPVADPFFIGLIGITPGTSEDTYFSVPTSVPEDLFFNAALYSFGTPNAIAVIQIATDTNGSGAFEEGSDEIVNVYDAPIEGEGWQLASVSMAATGFTSEQLQEIISVRVLLISNDAEQPDPPLPVEFGIDYITFTAGGPFEL